MALAPAVHGEQDQIRTIFNIADDDAAFLPGLPSHGREVQRDQRLAMPPGAATQMYRWVTRLDVRSVLPSIAVPTLVLHRKNNSHSRLAYGRYLAENIPGARLVELPGGDCYPFHTQEGAGVLDEIQEFLTGVRKGPPARARAGHRAVHGHRRFDRSRCGDRGCPLARGTGAA